MAKKKKDQVVKVNDTETYQAKYHGTLRKCFICSTKSSIGTDESSIGKMYGKFVCKDCIEATVDMYTNSGFKYGFEQFLKLRVKKKMIKKGLWIKKKYQKTVTKCRLCGMVIEGRSWKQHVMECHNIKNPSRMRDFCINPNREPGIAQREWYNPDRKETGNIPCGTKVNGTPLAKIIYTPVFSNKRKF